MTPSGNIQRVAKENMAHLSIQQLNKLPSRRRKLKVQVSSSNRKTLKAFNVLVVEPESLYNSCPTLFLDTNLPNVIYPPSPQSTYLLSILISSSHLLKVTRTDTENIFSSRILYVFLIFQATVCLFRHYFSTLKTEGNLYITNPQFIFKDSTYVAGISSQAVVHAARLFSNAAIVTPHLSYAPCSIIFLKFILLFVSSFSLYSLFSRLSQFPPSLFIFLVCLSSLVRFFV